VFTTLRVDLYNVNPVSCDDTALFGPRRRALCDGPRAGGVGAAVLRWLLFRG
jgi:hypothetical protein